MTCQHKFLKKNRTRFRLFQKSKWICIHCGLASRLYDSADRMAMRPLHPHMSVAVKGYNTVEGPHDR